MIIFWGSFGANSGPWQFLAPVAFLALQLLLFNPQYSLWLRACITLAVAVASGPVYNARRQAQAGEGGARPGRPQSAQSGNADAAFDRVTRVLQKLPTEQFLDEAGLQALPAKALKERLLAHGVKWRTGELLDRQEAVHKLLNEGGSTSVTCTICCEEYVAQDSLRILPCNHRFHLECIDRWFLIAGPQAARCSSPAAAGTLVCPVCNIPVVRA